MRPSGTMMNLGAALALLVATGSLWHAYKVRFTDHEVEPSLVGEVADVAAATAANAKTRKSETPETPRSEAASSAVQTGSAEPLRANVLLRDNRGIVGSGPRANEAEPSPAERLPPQNGTRGTSAPGQRDIAAASAVSAQPANSKPADREADPTVFGVRLIPCGPFAIESEAQDGGMMRVAVTSACRAGQEVRFEYAGATQVRKFDASGKLDYVLNCFAGTKSDLQITFADGTRQAMLVTAKGID